MRRSAGLLLYRLGDAGIEVLLVHPGGPFWIRRDAGAWTIPKGEFDAPESPLAAARREFEEETGTAVDGRFHALRTIRQAGGKHVHAFAVEADFDAQGLTSNTFELEWPPRSGRLQRFPEIDRAAWFPIERAAAKINPAQSVWLDDVALLGKPGDT